MRCISALLSEELLHWPNVSARLGKPVEARVRALLDRAAKGTDALDRVHAVSELSRFRDFDLTGFFIALLPDTEDDVSRSAAVALVRTRRPGAVGQLAAALGSGSASARKNAAWALGMFADDQNSDRIAKALTPLLKDSRTPVVFEALLALSRCPGSVDVSAVRELSEHPDPLIRGAAATLLARQDRAPAPVEAAAIRLRHEFIAAPKDPADFGPVLKLYRAYMEVVKAYTLLPPGAAEQLLLAEMERTDKDAANVGAGLAAFRLWEFAARDPLPVIAALASPDAGVRRRAQWVLIKAGTGVIPQVRQAAQSSNPDQRRSATEVLTWLERSAAIEAVRP